MIHILVYPWNCSHVNATRLHWWEVNIGSGNGLVPSGTKPLPVPMLTHIYAAIMASLGHNKWVGEGLSLTRPFTDSGQRGPCNPYKPCNRPKWVKPIFRTIHIVLHTFFYWITEQLINRKPLNYWTYINLRNLVIPKSQTITIFLH